MERRTFRKNSCVAYIGGIIATVGAVIIGISAFHLVTGIPLMQGDGKIRAGVRPATVPELWFGIIGISPLLILGVALILTTLTSAITIDAQGITATNLFTRTYFQADWADITGVERTDERPSSGYTVTANGKTLGIDLSTPHLDELIAEIRKRAGH